MQSFMMQIYIVTKALFATARGILWVFAKVSGSVRRATLIGLRGSGTTGGTSNEELKRRIDYYRKRTEAQRNEGGE